MMKLLGGALTIFSVILGILGYFGFQQVMKSQLEKWAQDEFKVKIEASKALAESAAQNANKSLGEVNAILAGLRAKAVVPIGTIVPWFPPEVPKEGVSLNTIVPQGWAICDGSNGTPNLQDRFVLGTLDPNSIGKQGGSKTHNHTASFSAPRFEADNVGSRGTGASEHDRTKVSVNEAEAMPPYTMLVYIMKLP
ncbi:hypothetical protein [Tahibacter soli]|uniref:Tail collar domain n=1 Tax=Tahibacter soli TaxID=2983605 RepID=A0A9X3YHE7_9GAMM|nr:hypothetical protein [Tahibacter soli]MDC8012276.1 hypothetical protein [Tahibacter soli]